MSARDINMAFCTSRSDIISALFSSRLVNFRLLDCSQSSLSPLLTRKKYLYYSIYALDIQYLYPDFQYGKLFSTLNGTVI